MKLKSLNVGLALLVLQAISPLFAADNGILFKFEFYSMPKIKARRAFLTQGKPTELHHWLVESLPDATKQVMLEKLILTCGTSGQRNKVEELEIFQYAVAWQPSKLPQSFSGTFPSSLAPAPPDPASVGVGLVELKGPAERPVVLKFPRTPITSTSFQETKLGWSIEIDPVLSLDRKIVELNVAPLYTKLLRKISYDKYGETWQPVFLTQRLNTNVTCKVGEPTLLGTFNPSPDAGVGAPAVVNDVWFAYVTATLP